jgi:translation initiation factor 2B subunit (eIF-2B alpha/beta/delta family)
MNEELQGVKNELLAAIQEVRAEQKESEIRIVREMTQMVHQVVHDTETKLLTAFFRWQENSNVKFQRLKADTGNATREIELRLENVEARLEEVEKRYLSGGGPTQ